MIPKTAIKLAEFPIHMFLTDLFQRRKVLIEKEDGTFQEKHDFGKVYIFVNGVQYCFYTGGYHQRVFSKSLVCASCGKEGHHLTLYHDPTNPIPKYQTNMVLEAEDGTLMTADHILPRSRGGTNDLSNLQVMCIKCNNKKGATIPEGVTPTKDPKVATIKHTNNLEKKLSKKKKKNDICYVVVKTSRSGSNRTYTGLTWEEAGMIPPTLKRGEDRHALLTFKKFSVAEKIANRLSKFNPVGFVVERYEPPKVTE